MKFLSLLGIFTIALAADSRPPWSYATALKETYTPPKNTSAVTLLDFIKSRDDLSQLAKYINNSAGMMSAIAVKRESC